MKKKPFYFDPELFIDCILNWAIPDLRDKWLKALQNKTMLEEHARAMRRSIMSRTWAATLKLSETHAHESIYELLASFFHIDKNEPREFQTFINADLNNIPLSQVVQQLGLWLCKKHRNRQFIFVSTGEKWDEAEHRLYFDTEKAPALLITFVPTLHLLLQKIDKKPRFGDPSSEEIAAMYSASYGQNILHAIHSGVYAHITVLCDDDTGPLIVLTRMKTSPVSYAIQKANAADNAKAFYLNALLQALLIPLKTPCQLLYDADREQWYAHC